jgi:hypothetical protein
VLRANRHRALSPDQLATVAKCKELAAIRAARQHLVVFEQELLKLAHVDTAHKLVLAIVELIQHVHAEHGRKLPQELCKIVVDTDVHAG